MCYCVAQGDDTKPAAVLLLEISISIIPLLQLAAGMEEVGTGIGRKIPHVRNMKQENINYIKYSLARDNKSHHSISSLVTIVPRQV